MPRESCGWWTTFSQGLRWTGTTSVSCWEYRGTTVSLVPATSACSPDLLSVYQLLYLATRGCHDGRFLRLLVWCTVCTLNLTAHVRTCDLFCLSVSVPASLATSWLPCIAHWTTAQWAANGKAPGLCRSYLVWIFYQWKASHFHTDSLTSDAHNKGDFHHILKCYCCHNQDVNQEPPARPPLPQELQEHNLNRDQRQGWTEHPYEV